MKAIICPQCGGIIDKVTEGKTIAGCDYCGAKVYIPLAEKPPPEPEPHDTLHIPLSDYKPFDDYDPVNAPKPGEETWADVPLVETGKGIGFLAAGIGIIAVIVFIGYVASQNRKSSKGFTSTPAPYRTATPNPPVSVPPVTNEDAIILPKPVVPKNLRIARRMNVEVYVSVDEQGNVYDASAYTDIDSLNKIMVATAKQAKFRPSLTNQRTSGVLTYTIGP